MSNYLTDHEWQKIKQIFIKQSISEVGISESDEVPEIVKGNFLAYLQSHYNGDMKYLERNLEKRFSPTTLYPGTQSIITFLLPYYQIFPAEWAEKISIYVTKKDYHTLAKSISIPVVNFLKQLDANFRPRIFVDSAPVIDKYWAWKAGLGFIGKNTLLINEKYGSFVFIVHIFTSLKAPPDALKNPLKNKCGNCTNCLKACPTQALISPKVLNASQCISYLTIEKSDNNSLHQVKKLVPYIYGCDICQKKCPYNNNPQITPIKDFLFDEQEKQELKNWGTGISKFPLYLLNDSVLMKNVNFIKNKYKS
ncbi:MAG: tRNA epoxyqueuosine(34) reductase QueG [Bacteroidales bacterium]|jgi:epoxyqueuosine reductase|nr:tRNA epoxyqueuosine(34) reductase QueG [Bacteroidales bacterium]MDI9575154.1 tRNA epoxyqueuosine(34) reductase QueG [Bacteroidota bacterium]MDD2592965.1 tRNA epoxyqueuosine(34) reductase QueG [Bacteroidales bacterium]MDD3755730.1 tRNA epoxyqueuosine(34) reductase QueG [Bacteroidales bacterium]MDY0400819.1 tRNA epoxyqueuosine(34) reductase QueG [Bacteroidales bacterium]